MLHVSLDVLLIVCRDKCDSKQLWVHLRQNRNVVRILAARIALELRVSLISRSPDFGCPRCNRTTPRPESRVFGSPKVISGDKT